MDLDGSIFWYFGGALVLAALAISFIGVRGKDSFPPSRRAMGVGLAAFTLLVVTTVAYAVANASEEKEHRDAEIAEDEALASEEVESGDAAAANPGGSPGGETPTESGAAPGGEQAPSEQASPQVEGGTAQTLDVTSPPDGSLVFEPDALRAAAGAVKIAYANPSPVSHNVAIEDEAGQLLAESSTVANEDTEASAELVPGEYVFFCTIPGHREGGMEGVLTVE